MIQKHECRFLKTSLYPTAPCYGCKHPKNCKDYIPPEKSLGHIGFSVNDEYFEYKNGIYRASVVEPIEPAYGTRRIYGPMNGRAIWMCASGSPAHYTILEWFK